MGISREELKRREKYVFGKTLDEPPSKDDWRHQFYKPLYKEDISEKELEQLKEATRKAQSLVDGQLKNMGLK